VCHKHRKIRRETNPAGVSSRELAAVFVLFFVIGGAEARKSARAAIHVAVIVQEQDACLPVRRCRCKSGCPHHFIFIIRSHGGRQPAQRSLQISAGPGQHRDAVPPGDDSIIQIAEGPDGKAPAS
jgi:hypothetical protein